MLRLTTFDQTPIKIFVNPRLVTTVAPLRGSYGGCSVIFGRSEDALEVRESADDVAREIADQIGIYGIIPVAENAAEQAQRRREMELAQASCAGDSCPGCPGCEVPF